MSRPNIDWRVDAILRRRGAVGDRPTDDFNYVKAGLVDSLSLLRLVLELEAEFHIEFTNDEVAAPEFKTFGGLCSIIERKQS